MPEKEDCICEPLEVDAPQPLQNDILMVNFLCLKNTKTIRHHFLERY